MAKRKRIIRTVANSALRKRNENKEEQQQEDDNVPYLPSDILLKILEFLPAQYLYDVVQFVSKTLAGHILHSPEFIGSQLLHSDFAGFFVHFLSSEGCHLQLFQLSRQRQGSQLQLSVKHMGFERGVSCGSCDGVLLMYSLVSSSDIFLANPVTKQLWRLLDHPEQYHCFVYTKLARIPETGVFKVVTVSDSSLLILTVGSNMSWRKLSTDCFSAEYCFSLQICGLDRAVCVGGVLYWVAPMCVFALDLRDESLHRIEFPLGFHDSVLHPNHPVQIGKDICFIRLKSGFMDLWVLKDFRQNEWVLLERKILLFDRSFRRKCFVKPLLYWESEKALVIICNSKGRFKPCLDKEGYEDDKVMVYNMVTGKRDFLDARFGFATTFKHTNSLVRL